MCDRFLQGIRFAHGASWRPPLFRFELLGKHPFPRLENGWSFEPTVGQYWLALYSLMVSDGLLWSLVVSTKSNYYPTTYLPQL